jgi:hypothetical protein
LCEGKGLLLLVCCCIGQVGAYKGLQCNESKTKSLVLAGHQHEERQASKSKNRQLLRTEVEAQIILWPYEIFRGEKGVKGLENRSLGKQVQEDKFFNKEDRAREYQRLSKYQSNHRQKHRFKPFILDHGSHFQ